MSKKVSPIPRGYRTATPCLTVNGVDEAVAFYRAAFDAELLTRQVGADESTAVHATIKIGNSIIALNQQAPESGTWSPADSGVSGSQIHLYVDDVDVNWNRAVEAGAVVNTPLYDAYWGDRTGSLLDKNGHVWSIASKIENVSQDEVSARAKAAFAPYTAVPAELEYVADEVADDSATLENTVAA